MRMEIVLGAGGRALSAALAALAAFFAAGAFAAAVEDPGELVEGARLYSSEVPDTRGNFRRDLWRFEPGGALTASYSITVPEPDGTGIRTLGDSGTWRVRDDALCLQWHDLWAGEERCFRVAAAAGRAYGERMFRATNVETGETWRFALAR